jgi:prolyl oligopeptidase
VVDTYYGVRVADPYRWLESSDDPKVRAWTAAQDQRTRAYLDGLSCRQPIFDRLLKQASDTSSSFSSLYAVGESVFALYTQPPKQQPMISVLARSLDPGSARILVDPNVINPKGTTAIDWFVPSPNGALVAVSMSENGSEDGSLHIFEVASGSEVGEVIPRVQYPTAGGSLAWREDSKGFWYTRYPGPERSADEQHFFQTVYFHELGRKSKDDTLVLGQDFPKIAEVALDSRQNPKYVVVSVANGDGGTYAHYVIDQKKGHATRITRFEDEVVAAAIGPDDAMYLVSRKNAPRGKLLKLELDDPVLAHARVIVPESDAVMQPAGEFGGEPIIITPRALYVRELVGGPSRVAIFDHDGKARGVLPLPEVAAVEEVAPIGGGTLLYSVKTYVTPPYFSRYDETTGKADKSPLAETSPISFEDTEVVREFAISKDGTRVPLNIVRRKGTKLNGENPVILYGYGGYGISETPHYLGSRVRLWLDAGGVYVLTNLRGGGEFGEEWHRMGALTHKQNVFDDFTAAARHLIAEHYTTPQHLAILGGSNGGLLMGAALTQHPELFRAVVSLVGIYDMLRVELDPNGAFNTTEFGSTRNSEQFKVLLAYSPYQHVVDGARYPAIFMATGENDGRVNPMHSRKMIARLQAAAAPGGPIYLSSNANTGHGVGSSLTVRVNLQADYMSFLFDQMGMKFP